MALLVVVTMMTMLLLLLLLVIIITTHCVGYLFFFCTFGMSNVGSARR
jgi:hypothetical protein